MNRRAALACLFFIPGQLRPINRARVLEDVPAWQPATTPVDMEMRVRLFVNERTLRELGLLLPTPLRLRADRIVD